MDVEEAAVAGRGAAAARSFLLQLSDLRSDENQEAFEVLREEIGVNARYKRPRRLSGSSGSSSRRWMASLRIPCGRGRTLSGSG